MLQVGLRELPVISTFLYLQAMCYPSIPEEKKKHNGMETKNADVRRSELKEGLLSLTLTFLPSRKHLCQGNHRLL